MLIPEDRKNPSAAADMLQMLIASYDSQSPFYSLSITINANGLPGCTPRDAALDGTSARRRLDGQVDVASDLRKLAARAQAVEGLSTQAFHSYGPHHMPGTSQKRVG